MKAERLRLGPIFPYEADEYIAQMKTNISSPLRVYWHHSKSTRWPTNQRNQKENDQAIEDLGLLRVY